MKERIEKLLKNLLLEYIKTAEPVASSLLVDKLDEKVSSATIRSELVELEKAGFIRQPHTSAGRVPTEKAYQYYVDNFLREVDMPRQEEKALRQVWSLDETARAILKLTAKIIASFSEESVFLAFDKHDVYY